MSIPLALRLKPALLNVDAFGTPQNVTFSGPWQLANGSGWTGANIGPGSIYATTAPWGNYTVLTLNAGHGANDSGDLVNISGPVSGSCALTKGGSGILELSGDNSAFSGPLTRHQRHPAGRLPDRAGLQWRYLHQWDRDHRCPRRHPPSHPRSQWLRCGCRPHPQRHRQCQRQRRPGQQQPHFDRSAQCSQRRVGGASHLSLHLHHHCRASDRLGDGRGRQRGNGRGQPRRDPRYLHGHP